MAWGRLSLALAAASLPLPAAANAQLGHYQPGSSDIRDFFLPDPGFGVELFASFYTSGTYRDANRDPLVVELEDGVEVRPETDIFTLTPSVSWNPGSRLLGTAYAVVVSPSVANAHLAAEGAAAGKGNVREETNFGRADITVQPLWLGYDWGRTHVAGGYAFWAPIGEYRSDGIDNIGLGFWSHRFQLSGYFFFDERRQNLGGVSVESWVRAGSRDSAGTRSGR